jgi:hypothetical protein
LTTQAERAHIRRGGSGSSGERGKKAALTIAATLVSVNIWTGAPLLAVWVGSRVVSAPGLTMGAFFVILAVLAALVSLLVVTLVRLNAAYDRLTGRPPEARTSPWLRSLRGEREEVRISRAPLSGVERAVVASVVVAVLSFEIWFFFFAHYVFQGI